MAMANSNKNNTVYVDSEGDLVFDIALWLMLVAVSLYALLSGGKVGVILLWDVIVPWIFVLLLYDWLAKVVDLKQYNDVNSGRPFLVRWFWSKPGMALSVFAAGITFPAVKGDLNDGLLLISVALVILVVWECCCLMFRSISTDEHRLLDRANFLMASIFVLIYCHGISIN